MQPQTQQQQLKVTETELSKIKEVFLGNDALLKAMRGLFFGLGITDAEKELIKTTFANDEIYNIVKNRFYPTLKKDDNIGQAQDIWLGAETMIFGVPRDTIVQAIQYKDRAMKMVKRGLDLLKDPISDGIHVEYNPNIPDELGIDLLARNQYVRHVESQLLFLKVIAETKKDTPKEAEERATKNSAR